MNEIILTKNSGSEELKAYFSGILKLSQSNEEYPVNLDEVWMLVYSEKGKAVRALRKNFIENEDFKVFAQNGKNPDGGRPDNIYMLSLSCLEYFIARKVRSVFNVYRDIFHKVPKVMKEMPSYQIQDPIKRAEIWIAEQKEKERLALENKEKDVTIERQSEQIATQKEEIQKSASKVEYYDNVMQSVNTLTATQVAKTLGMADANRLNRKLCECGVCYRQSGQILLRTPFSTWGLHATRTQTYTRSDGSTGTSSYTVWTQKGMMFIHALSTNDWNAKKAVAYIQGKKQTAEAV